jgi:hypothetical protein
MELLYITNSKGKRISVILPIDYYNYLVKRTKKLEEMQNKEALKKTKKPSKKNKD